jgi:hypothetical protein
LGRLKFKADYWGIFLSFQALKSIACLSLMTPHLRYSIAVPNELMQYRAGTDPLFIISLQGNVPLWPRPG